ncbi:hypothetical protein QM7_0621 [Clostridioides difficile DA00232]|nr:hypothetical protein QM7_0621 [Clostridioides difficile DA00232]EQH58176.1 hypothetical protein QMC_0633 [Clostridioides difficile DA00245]
MNINIDILGNYHYILKSKNIYQNELNKYCKKFVKLRFE